MSPLQNEDKLGEQQVDNFGSLEVIQNDNVFDNEGDQNLQTFMDAQ